MLSIKLPPCGKAYAVGKYVELAVAVHVVQPGGLHWAWFLDEVRLPRCVRFLLDDRPGVLDPIQCRAAVVGADEIDPAVAVDVELQAGIVIEASPNDFHIAHEMLLPRRCLVPMPAGNDVELAVLIHIDGSTRAVGCLGVDVVTPKPRVLGGVCRLASPSGRCQKEY